MDGRACWVLVATALVALVLGSIHGFSVFLTPLEARFGAARAVVSLTYSFGLMALTAAVLLGPRVFGRVPASGFVLGVCLIAALGCLVAGFSAGLWQVWLGYSLVFGAANGLGYGFGLQLAAQGFAGREGFAMGVVTAAYAGGAVLSPGAFETLVAAGGFAAAMGGLAGVLVVAGLVSSAILHGWGVRYEVPVARRGRLVTGLGMLWLAYFGAVLAGLMVIGHAAGIAAVRGAVATAWLAPVVIAACNLAGSVLGGALADRMPARRVLGALAALSGVALLWLAADLGGVFAALGLVGFAYGGTIAAYPAAIAKMYGGAASAQVYGRVFTAWGVAGLAGPWLAGALYDRQGDYRLPLGLAAVAAAVSVLAVRRALADVGAKSGSPGP